MALRDLISSRHELNEAAIEAIVSDFVRYDPAKDEIILTPTAVGLNNRQKILTYLVALEGWVYIKPELEGVAAKPAELERELGIPGGSLRPLLRELASRRLVKSHGGAYRILAANLAAITAELSGGQAPVGKALKPSAARRKRTHPKGKDALNGTRKRAKATSANRGSQSAGSMFKSWIEAGDFKTPRSMKDMLEEFHNKGVIMKMTTLSKLPLTAVRKGTLVRKRGEINGKRVWLYSSEA